MPDRPTRSCSRPRPARSSPARRTRSGCCASRTSCATASAPVARRQGGLDLRLGPHARATTRGTSAARRWPAGSARRASRSSPAAGPGSWRPPTAAPATPACRRSASASSCRTSRAMNDYVDLGAELPLLLHAQGHVRPLRERLRGLPGRLRHARRAVRGRDPAPDGEDPLLPDRARRTRATGTGLVDWLRGSMLADGNIDEPDIDAARGLPTTSERVVEIVEDVEHRRAARGARRRARRALRLGGLEHPLAVAAAEGERSRAPLGLARGRRRGRRRCPGGRGPRPAAARRARAPRCSRVDAARGALERLAVPAAVGSGRGGEVVVDLLQLGVEARLGALEVTGRAMNAADGEDRRGRPGR